MQRILLVMEIEQAQADLLNLVYLTVGGVWARSVKFEDAWQALGDGQHETLALANELFGRGLAEYDADVMCSQGGGFPWFLWITEEGVKALKTEIGVWDIHAERRVGLRSFSLLCGMWSVTFRRELGDERFVQLTELAAEMRSLEYSQRGEALALGRRAKQLLAGVEGPSCEKARGILNKPSLVARRRSASYEY